MVGKYNGDKLEMTASEAATAVLKHTDPMGLEVIIPEGSYPRKSQRPIWHPADHRVEVLS